MAYVGIQTQIRRNNFRSIVLLILFPGILLLLTWVFTLFVTIKTETYYDSYGYEQSNWSFNTLSANEFFVQLIPFVLGATFLWFVIAYFSNTEMIRAATGSRPLQRNENKRVYNLVENLCMSQGMDLPKINIIEDDSLNAFASGIDKKSYTVTLSRGIIDTLNDEELETVIAHELTHIRNRDVRLLIVSIVFVGIFAFISQMAFRMLLYGGNGRRSKDDKGGGIIILVLVLVLAVVGYICTLLFRFALSRKREFMADAGAAEMTKRPDALASALRKIAQDSRIEAVERDDVAQLFIDNPKEKKRTLSFASLFATHPPIEKRIAVLEQF
jgi:heat shock protein HtpX